MRRIAFDLLSAFASILLLVVIYGLLLFLLVRMAFGDPVPEPAPIEGRGNRGLAEMREPAGKTASLRYLMRSCRDCHSDAGNAGVPGRDGRPYYTLIFDKAARMQPKAAKAYLLKYINLGWEKNSEFRAKTEEERFDLRRAEEMLKR